MPTLHPREHATPAEHAANLAAYLEKLAAEVRSRTPRNFEISIDADSPAPEWDTDLEPSTMLRRASVTIEW